MDFSKYIKYDTAEFLDDDYFVNSQFAPNTDTEAFWAEFIKQHPEKSETISQAILLITAFRQQKVFTNEDRQQAVWNKIEDTFKQQGVSRGRILRLPVFFKVAAVLAVVLTIGFAYRLYQHRVITINTTFGQVKTITLPDQSTVTLNGNSSVSFARTWNKSIREVWIKGEGLFKVIHLNKTPAHIKDSERFIVHCQSLNIEVLGTTFNVKDRHDKTDVSLINGKILIRYEEGNSKNRVNDLVMKPGEFIEYSRRHISTRLTLPKPQAVTTWTQHQLWFTDVKLREIAEVLEDNYGYEITFTDDKIADERIEGDIKVSDVNQLMETIRTTLRVKIDQHNNQITISSLKP